LAHTIAHAEENGVLLEPDWAQKSGPVLGTRYMSVGSTGSITVCEQQSIKNYFGMPLCQKELN